MHNHKKEKQCKHADLKFCKDCDTVYCGKCKKEWKQFAPVPDWEKIREVGSPKQFPDFPSHPPYYQDPFPNKYLCSAKHS